MTKDLKRDFCLVGLERAWMEGEIPVRINELSEQQQRAGGGRSEGARGSTHEAFLEPSGLLCQWHRCSNVLGHWDQSLNLQQGLPGEGMHKQTKR